MERQLLQYGRPALRGFGTLTHYNTIVADVAYQIPATPDPMRDDDDDQQQVPYPLAQVAAASWENDQLVTLAATQTPVILRFDDNVQVRGVLRASRMHEVWEILPAMVADW